MESKNKRKPILRFGVFCKKHLQREIGKLIQRDGITIDRIIIFPYPPFGWKLGDSLEKCPFGQEDGFWAYGYYTKRAR